MPGSLVLISIRILPVLPICLSLESTVTFGRGALASITMPPGPTEPPLRTITPPELPVPGVPGAAVLLPSRVLSRLSRTSGGSRPFSPPRTVPSVWSSVPVTVFWTPVTTPPTLPVTPVTTPPTPGSTASTDPPSVVPRFVTMVPMFGSRPPRSWACAGAAATAVPALSAPIERSAAARRERSASIRLIRHVPDLA